MAVAALLGTGDATSAVKSTSGNTHTVPIPANTVKGDVLLAIYTSDYAGPVTTTTPGWTKISTTRISNTREAAVFHAFTKDSIPAAPAFVQTGGSNVRASAAIYRVVGASQEVAVAAAGPWPATAETANTTGFTFPATGATGDGLTIAVAYNNMNTTQDNAAGTPTFNGLPASQYLKSYGTGAPGTASSTAAAVFITASPGPFTLAWGKTVANSSGIAVTIPAAAGSTTPVEPEPEPEIPVEPEHDDEPGVMIQVGPGNVTTAAESGTGVNSVSVPIPSRTLLGDVLIAVVTHSGNQALAFPLGWTLISKVRSGTNRWLAAYAMPVSTVVPNTATFTCNGETDLRMSAVMARVTGVGPDDYLKMVGDWQLTAAEVNKTSFTIPATTGVTAGRTLTVAYTNTTAGAAPALTTVANGVLVAHSYKAVSGAATTTLSVWRHHSGVNKDVTISPAAANAAGFQLTFQAPQPKSPASWEARVMQGGKLVSAEVAAVKAGNQFLKPSMVSWAPKDYVLDDLFSTDPFFIAHRGSGDNWPEHTMESYNNSTAYGVKALEVSVNMTKDGVLICHHDKDFVKTAGDPRLIADMTYAEILAQIKIDTRQWTGDSSTLAPPPLAKDVVDAFIDTHVIFIEDKGGTAATQLLNLMDTYPRGKEKFVWKQWAGANQWQAAKQRGYKLWGYFLADIFARIPELGPNFDYLGIPHTASDQVVSDIVAQGNLRGQPVIMWEIHYRWMFERAKALGVKGMMTSNIPYVFTTSTWQFREDQWHTGRRPAGDMPQSTDAGWGVQPQIDPANGGVVRYNDKASGALSLGSMCPVALSSYAIEWEMRFTGSLPADATHAGIYTGHASDRTHRTGTTATDGGYHIIQRVNGIFDLYRHDPNSAAGIPLGTVQGERPVLGQWMKFRVEMTPEWVTAKRLDGVGSVVSSADQLYRGQYFGLQKNFTVTAAEEAKPFEYRSVKVIPL